MRTETISIYKIDEHPDREKCFEWIRNNDFDIGGGEIDELVCSLKKLSEVIDGTVDWCLSHYPDRGEHITFKDYDKDLLFTLNEEKCPLTGFYWDIVVIEALRAEKMSKIFNALHKQIEYLYSDEALIEMCDDDDYEFYEGGKRV